MSALLITDNSLDHPSVQRLLREHLADMHRHSPPESVHAMGAAELAAADLLFLAAWAGPELAGVGAMKWLAGGDAEVKAMRTAQAFLRQGVADRILAALLEAALARGCARLWLETGSMAAFAPARAFYAARGFAECGPYADYVADPNSVFMVRELAAG